MKIIAGRFKGKNLEYRPRRGLRVTGQKVKEAMFGMIGELVEDANVLDLYCGYGSLGLEAISRGAKHVTFVDVDSQALKQLKYFLDKLNISDQAAVIKRDAVKALKHHDPGAFDLIVMDPPYHIRSEKKTMEAIDKYGIMKEDGMLVVEHHSENRLPDRIGGLGRIKEKKYGDTGVSVYVVGGKQPAQQSVQPEVTADEEDHAN